MSHLQHNRETAKSSNHDCPLGEEGSLAAAEKETRRLARSHYENFVVASVLLPRGMRQPFYNLYAFCRIADDLADESSSRQAALEQLARFQDRLNATFRHRTGVAAPTPQHDHVFIALADTIDRFSLPQQPFDDLLDAFRQDQTKTRYADFEELLDYCRRSANPVGRLVLCLGQCLDDESAALSDQICTGLQLANFWQDISRDHAVGRIYVPLDAMQRFGVSEEMFRERSTPVELRKLLASECERADEFLRRGLPLAERVPRWLARDVRLFAHGGLATLRAIQRIDFDVLGSRPTLSRLHQAGLVARAALRLL